MPEQPFNKNRQPVKIKTKRLADGTQLRVYIIPKKGKKVRGNRGKAK